MTEIEMDAYRAIIQATQELRKIRILLQERLPPSKTEQANQTIIDALHHVKDSVKGAMEQDGG